MTRVTTQVRMNMTMHRRTDFIVVAKSIGRALVLAFGFQGLVFGTVDVASLNAAESGMGSQHSLMKADSHQGSRTEGLAIIADGKPILKPEKESDRAKIGKKPRRLIRRPLSGGPQSESLQQADQGRPSSAPVVVDQGTPATKDSAAGMAKSAAGMSPVIPPISSGNSISTRSPGMPASSAIAGASTASPGSSMGAAGSGGSSSSGGRSAQNLRRQLPGLQQLLTTQPVTPGPPPEPIAAPAPPLGPPLAGLPPAPRIGLRTMS